MTESIAVAVITGVLAVFGTWVGNVSVSRKKTREDAIRDAKRDQELTDRLDRLEKKVDEHNGYAKRFEEIGKDIAVIKTEVSFIRKEQND
jgi:tetrahydromethanopterin S-methyltransferase subunit G